jgi:hypothetical protein
MAPARKAATHAMIAVSIAGATRTSDRENSACELDRTSAMIASLDFPPKLPSL